MEQNCLWLFYYFNFERNCDFLKSTSPSILLNKNINLKMENRTTVLERRILCFRSCKNRKLKVKLLWAGARERKKRAFFVSFTLSEGNFLNICVLSQCTVYWMHFHNINVHTFTYQKNITSYTFLLVYKIVESLQCILNFLNITLSKFISY